MDTGIPVPVPVLQQHLQNVTHADIITADEDGFFSFVEDCEYPATALQVCNNKQNLFTHEYRLTVYKI